MKTNTSLYVRSIRMLVQSDIACMHVEKRRAMNVNNRWGFNCRLLVILVLVSLLSAGCGTSSKNTDESPGEQPKQETVSEETVLGATVTAVSGTDTLPTEHEPDSAYDKYALVDYLVEDIGAEFTATVSAKEDGSEYEVRCTLENEEQVVVLDRNLVIISDKTGNMGYDAPFVVQKAIEENNWTEIDK